jgi:Mrp family chromosome partitioning ATPase
MSDLGSIVTFYSYKGGAGRTMVLANTACLLAAAGHKVLAIDGDLEAPGLHRYLHPFLADPELSKSLGSSIWYGIMLPRRRGPVQPKAARPVNRKPQV